MQTLQETGAQNGVVQAASAGQQKVNGKADCEIITLLLNAAGNNFSSDIVGMQTLSQIKRIFIEKKPKTLK